MKIEGICQQQTCPEISVKTSYSRRKKKKICGKKGESAERALEKENIKQILFFLILMDLK